MLVTKLIKMYRIPILRKLARKLNKIVGCDIPVEVQIGNNVKIVHNGLGTVIHEKTILQDNVKIYQNVTLGRSNIWQAPTPEFKGFIVEKGAIICAGAKILTDTELTIGENSVIGANAVLTCSTGPNEIWAGCPARLIKYRDD